MTSGRGAVMSLEARKWARAIAGAIVVAVAISAVVAGLVLAVEALRGPR